MNVYVSKVLVLISVLGFVLTAFGVTLGDTTEIEMTAGSLAIFAASFLIP